ncbi:DNase I-like protein [Trametes versicolor FP-101664 SS1]|uniref:DNase I-like protein n=1 Tax=Trametes versicolor (strain FP-101664) TaxID=717944 RepID=UPI00046216ED|nr:DNase I-like protein [Trametes versicolor FP-101664 SS1]EIW58330.1 DNase I-like protein [Trametes versicolor FP-101664 SS1]
MLMQETHLTEERKAELHRMFANRIKIFYSPHPEAPTQKEGVAIVLNKKIINTEGARMTVVVPGRAMQLSLPWRGGEQREILCIYAPTSAGVAERRAFYQQVRDFYRTRPTVPKPDLMAGDFNNVEDVLDRSPATEDAVDASAEDLDELKADLGLMMVDGWRAVHPDTRDFTFQRGVGDARTMSRLDRIYVTRDLARWARDWKIEPVGVKTDHNMVSVMLTAPSEPAVGKGRPVFPLHLLKDKKLAAKMKSKGLEAMKDLEDVTRDGRTQVSNPQVILHKLKGEWLAMARQREKETVPKLIQEIGLLEARLAEVTNDKESGEALGWPKWRDSTTTTSRMTERM